jgi:hypothetical protein
VLDASSSGCACTAIRVRVSAIPSSLPDHPPCPRHRGVAMIARPSFRRPVRPVPPAAAVTHFTPPGRPVAAVPVAEVI